METDNNAGADDDQSPVDRVETQCLVTGQTCAPRATTQSSDVSQAVLDHEATGARVGIARCGEPLSGRVIPVTAETDNTATMGE